METVHEGRAAQGSQAQIEHEPADGHLGSAKLGGHVSFLDLQVGDRGAAAQVLGRDDGVEPGVAVELVVDVQPYEGSALVLPFSRTVVGIPGEPRILGKDPGILGVLHPILHEPGELETRRIGRGLRREDCCAGTRAQKWDQFSHFRLVGFGLVV